MSFTLKMIEKKYGIIPFEVALEAWSLGSTINCYVWSHGCTYSFSGNNQLLEESFYNTGISKDMITIGVWYIKKKK